MLSEEKNARYTRVGPGTPGGNLLRRYWQALCPVAEVTAENPKKRIRLLGEDLLVYLGAAGEYGCVAEKCVHRGCSLYYGFIEENDIRCPYHGWKFERTGRCVEQPFERADSPFKDRVRLAAYPVQKLAGMLFVYMGPDPAPLLPRWDVLVREGGTRKIEIRPLLNCNWLQTQENAIDTTHTYYLHGHQSHVKGLGDDFAPWYYRPILDYEFWVTEWGIEKRIKYGGKHPEDGLWPPALFPNMLRIPQGRVECLHWRVPVDDTHTRYIVESFIPGDSKTPAGDPDDVPVIYMPSDLTPDGDYSLESFFSQDRMAWETQGEIYDRGKEHLGMSDKGIAMFRRLLDEQITIVEQGGEPMALVRDPEKNRIIEFTSHSVNRLNTGSPSKKEGSVNG